MLGLGGSNSFAKGSTSHAVVNLDSNEFKGFIKYYTNIYNNANETRIMWLTWWTLVGTKDCELHKNIGHKTLKASAIRTESDIIMLARIFDRISEDQSSIALFKGFKTIFFLL